MRAIAEQLDTLSLRQTARRLNGGASRAGCVAATRSSEGAVQSASHPLTRPGVLCRALQIARTVPAPAVRATARSTPATRDRYLPRRLARALARWSCARLRRRRAR